MAITTPATFDPFAAVPTETETLDRFVRALSITNGFALFFAVNEETSERERLMAAVRNSISDKNIEVLDLVEEPYTFLTALYHYLKIHQPDVLFVVGMERWLRSSNDAQDSYFVGSLNRNRNSITETAKFPVVFWLPMYILVGIERASPDFFSVRTTVFDFSDTDAEGNVPSSLRIEDPSRKLSSEQVHELADLLMPVFADPSTRLALVFETFVGYPVGKYVLGRISKEGPTRLFVLDMILRLQDYGQIEPGVPALLPLLEAARTQMGAEHQMQLDRYIELLMGRRYKDKSKRR